MLGKLLVTLTSFVAIAVFGSATKASTSPASKPTPKPSDPRIGGFEFAEFYVGGATLTDQSLPTLVLLHAENSTPAEALKVLAPLTFPARVLVPLGSKATPAGRSYLDPNIQGAALQQALSKLAQQLEGFVAGAASRFAIAGRQIVVGLGTAGAAAVCLGLTGGPWIQLAYGLGGIVTEDMLPLAQVDHPFAVRKLSFGDAVGFEQLTAKTAAERGIDYLHFQTADVDLIDGALDTATSSEWLMPTLAKDLAAQVNAPPASLGGWSFAEFYVGATKPTDKAPTFVLLHAEDSTPEAALTVLAGLNGPARVLVPLGPQTTPHGRGYLPAGVEGGALHAAVSSLAGKLQPFIDAVAKQFPVLGRLIVVGLGAAGAIATLVGLQSGKTVRLAYGLGGVVSADMLPFAQEPHAHRVRKLSWGEAEDFEEATVKTAVERGITYLTIDFADVDPLNNQLDLATSQAWLKPLLLGDLIATAKE